MILFIKTAVPPSAYMPAPKVSPSPTIFEAIVDLFRLILLPADINIPAPCPTE